MKHNLDIKKLALNAAAGSVTTAYIDLAPGGGKHICNGRFLVNFAATPNTANAGTTAVTLTHSDVAGSGYVAVPGYGTMVVTGAGGVGAPAGAFSMPIAAHLKRYVKAVFTQTGTGDNSAVIAEFAVEL